ncbi:hypothetical protein BGX34_002807, partial [Mortierella sp. NVP85]
MDLSMVVIAGWNAVLARLSGQDDIIIGYHDTGLYGPVSGYQADSSNIIPLRLDLSGEPSISQILERVRKTAPSPMDRTGFPLGGTNEITGSPLFQVAFQWSQASLHSAIPFQAEIELQFQMKDNEVVGSIQFHSGLFNPDTIERHVGYLSSMLQAIAADNNEISEWQLPGLEVVHVNASCNIAKFDLNLTLYESDNEITGGLSYSTALFDRTTMERYVGYLSSMLQAIAADVNQPVTSVDLLSQAERDLVLGKWNETERAYPTDLCIHHLFEQQVERTPQATALVFNEQSLTYTELNERANRLAHHLIILGVRPNSLVAICVERSFAMIIGVLAILKAGGAYVPLDPVYASNRLKDILADASPSIAVADATGRATLGEAVSSMTVVDPNDLQGTDQRPESVESTAPSQLVRNPHVPGLIPPNLAYIIYTSGSTGKPKGVMIEHQGVVNLIHGRPESFGISTSSRVLQFTSLNFDHSVSEIFSTLTSGASLHLIQDDIRLDQHQLWKYLMKHSITH